VPDKYESIRSLPFPALASALGLDLYRFKTRKDREYDGPCPFHQRKNHATSFSYAAGGKFNLFQLRRKGRGGMNLTNLVKNLGFNGEGDVGGEQRRPATGSKNPAVCSLLVPLLFVSAGFS
jgi:hypothetical protein